MSHAEGWHISNSAPLAGKYLTSLVCKFLSSVHRRACIVLFVDFVVETNYSALARCLRVAWHVFLSCFAYQDKYLCIGHSLFFVLERSPRDFTISCTKGLCRTAHSDVCNELCWFSSHITAIVSTLARIERTIL